MIDLILLVILAGVTWCVASEGAWGAGLMLVTVVFAGLLAMNFFEPAAMLLDSFNTSQRWRSFTDIIALTGLFAGFVALLRAAGIYFVPSFIEVHGYVHDIGRWFLGLLTGYVTMAFLLTALHTVPLPRKVNGPQVTEFLGFKAERDNFFGFSPDRQWLGFVQWVSEKSLRNGNRIFDGPQHQVGAYNGPWASFPIRYAHRREQLATAAVQSQQPVGLQPSQSGAGAQQGQGQGQPQPQQGGGAGPGF